MFAAHNLVDDAVSRIFLWEMNTVLEEGILPLLSPET